jgi:hypothetical protein
VPTVPGGSVGRRTAGGDRFCGDRPAVAGDDRPVAGASGDRQIALPVGAVHPHAVVREPAQQPARGMAVRVVRADRHQRHPRPRGRQEARVGVGAAVVRDLEDVRGQVDAVPHQAGLGLRAQVTGQQDPQPVDRHPDDQ